MRILIVGDRGGTHVGGSFERAATAAGAEVRVIESRLAFDVPFLVHQINWRLLGRRPARLGWFSERVWKACDAWRPDCVLAMGTAPLDRKALDRIAALGIPVGNYLTDDPWSRFRRSRWLLEALPGYSHVFSPRRSNLEDLERLGCAGVSYLPFAYDPELQFPEPPTGDEVERYAADVLFVGGADRDRVPYAKALTDAGLRVALYGVYWSRFRATRPHARGIAEPAVLRRATAGAKLSLCLVRRANRDGHVMRSFEIPAAGGCMLAEDTEEHRELFGPEGEAVAYFRRPDDMVEAARRLLASPGERERLAASAHAVVTGGEHTYADRLREMLSRMGLARQEASPSGFVPTRRTGALLFRVPDHS